MSELSALIIEDDLPLAKIYAKALRLAGYEPEIVPNGRDALSRLGEMAPELILLDLHLPEVPGSEILQSVRADPRLDNTQIIITTADPILGEEFRDQVDLVLLKPISFSQLRDLTLRMRPD
jgi:two-component system response regulator TrcR